MNKNKSVECGLLFHNISQEKFCHHINLEHYFWKFCFMDFHKDVMEKSGPYYTVRTVSARRSQGWIMKYKRGNSRFESFGVLSLLRTTTIYCHHSSPLWPVDGGKAHPLHLDWSVEGTLHVYWSARAQRRWASLSSQTPWIVALFTMKLIVKRVMHQDTSRPTLFLRTRGYVTCAPHVLQVSGTIGKQYSPASISLCHFFKFLA